MADVQTRLFFACVVSFLMIAAPAQGGITSMFAHGVTFNPGTVVPVFVDPAGARSSIIVYGQYMDLATGVSSNDSSFTPATGRRTGGSNTSLEVLINANAAPDQDAATITIHFVSGEETFRVRAFRNVITSLVIRGRAQARCTVGEEVTLEARGSVENVGFGVGGTMLDVADSRYRLLGKLSSSTGVQANFSLRCTGTGQFTISRSWFKDSRLTGAVGDAMVRGQSTLTVTVDPAP